jgi:hypothetical protein
MNLQPTVIISGPELRPGYRALQITNSDKINFQFFAVCDEVSPQSWHVEVVLFGAVIVKTPSAPSEDEALRKAEATLRDRLVRLLSD